MNALIGNTYEHREIIKKHGGRWDSIKKCWMVPTQYFEELSILCMNAKPQTKNQWGLRGVRYDEQCCRCRRDTTICNSTEICEKCFSK